MRYLIALGGNALDKSNINVSTNAISLLHKNGNEVAITHGNGPQVGALAAIEKKNLALLTAQTEAEIGLAIEEGLHTEKRKVATLITRVLVDPRDRAFRHPSKPIGIALSKSEATEMQKHGFTIHKTTAGLRRVVASPMPRGVLEAKFITQLLKDGYMVIAGGGGGVPIFYRNGRLNYADAVLDKDLTSSLIAREIGADRFIILTKVDGAYTGFGTGKKARIGRIKVRELKGLLTKGEFEEGSMKPKVEACINFVKATGKTAVIGSLSRPMDAIEMRNVTVVTR